MSREDLVQATVQPAAVGGSVTYSPEQVAIVKASIDREVWECSGIELSDDALDSAAHAAIQNFLLLHRSDDRTESQRQNETDSLRLQREALLAALTECLSELGFTTFNEDDLKHEEQLGNGRAPIILKARAAISAAIKQ
jgi:hypothetical protein